MCLHSFLIERTISQTSEICWLGLDYMTSSSTKGVWESMCHFQILWSWSEVFHQRWSMWVWLWGVATEISFVLLKMLFNKTITSIIQNLHTDILIISKACRTNYNTLLLRDSNFHLIYKTHLFYFSFNFDSCREICF